MWQDLSTRRAHRIQPIPREVKPPHRASTAAAIRHDTGQHELPWLGRPVPRASSTPTPSRKSVSLGKGARLGSGRDHEARITLLEARRRRARPPHTRGMISAIAIGAPTTDLVVKTKLALHQGCLQQHQGTWSCLVRERTLRQGCRQQHQDGTWSSQVPERLPGLTCGDCPLVAKSLVCPIGMLSAC